ncbi:hypothetical protein Calag_0154 [Caldisphaera lagunensis DSM 15908]|uniref:Uncharacterized protein n=1 Tax=Caldisphaera lagunensis (strain DSM 15908 / JCM 11604 / ANMR 0165 / IC-154) TaxID=1056495 RepID=L0AA65_CALLD|nr:hypothetical protein [Caldisphaera lagunensis]AFZ69940.1 hypothetical protein Calag_0154 [Caldisphaera lagunensis DSM 15908]
MIQGRLIKVTGYYRDTSLIERVLSNFRKLLIDVYYINGMLTNDKGLYEIYLIVNENQNLNRAIINLKESVGIEYVDVLGEIKFDLNNDSYFKYFLENNFNKNFLNLIYRGELDG